MKDITMELRRLRHLIAVAEHGNFGRAAAAVYLTQPALSRSIQALEAEVGASLLDRRPSGVELTEIGRLVLRHAIELDAAADDLDRDVRLAKGLELGELRVGVGPWGGALLVGPAVGQLNAQHRRLRIQIVVAPWRELPARVRARDVDLMVGALDDLGELELFEHATLSVQETLVVARAGHPLTLGAPVTAADVFSFPLASPGMDSGGEEAITTLARTVGTEPARSGGDLVTIECDNADVLTRVVLETDALTFLPRFVVEAGDGRLTVVPFDLGLRHHFGAAWVRGRSLGGAGEAFLAALRAHAGTFPAPTHPEPSPPTLLRSPT